jgi:hypothetical protein
MSGGKIAYYRGKTGPEEKVLKSNPSASTAGVSVSGRPHSGLVQQPGWLSHKSRGSGVFFTKIRRIRPFFSGSCSITEVIEQLYC